MCGSRDPGTSRPHRPRRWWLPVAAVLAAVVAGPARTAADWPAELYNPQPAPGDVVLPMPCGGALALRPVDIPAAGPLDDRRIVLGGPGPDRGALEGPRPDHLAGSFPHQGGGRRYLLGKYEVTRLQYRSVTEERCPAPDDTARLPQADVSWIDAVVFADRYSRWLRRHHPGTLPADEGGEPGFVRLPTEAEWEFAARGGLAVSEAEFRDRVFPVPEGPGRYVWFAGPEGANGRAQRIGLLLPNPLGLHDIVGNLDEIVLEPFRLTRLDRLHGQAGGFTVRGGNYLTPADEVRTAWRQEIPHYQGAEPRRSPTTGFRVAVAGRVVTSRERLRAITQAWEALGRAAAAPGDAAPAAAPGGDPLGDLAVIAAATADPAVRQRLQSVALALRASFQARDEQRDRAARARLRLGTFLCQKLRDDGEPLARLRRVHAECIRTRGADDTRCRAQQARIGAEEATQWENLGYYADTVVGLVEDYDDTVLRAQLAELKRELAARGRTPLVPVAERFAAHVRHFRTRKTIPRSAWLADCERGDGPDT